MAIELISKSKQQYKANLHCHSTLSDGKQTPEELKEAYRKEGYQILAITDHCIPCPHPELAEEDFLLLTGYEAYIRPGGAPYNRYAPEVHLNLFAKDPRNDKLINYNADYCKYLPLERHAEFHCVGDTSPRNFSVEYINRFIETANEHGYLVAYNHPFWSMDSEERILSYRNIFSLEIYNTSSYMGNQLENAEPLYDVMLRHGHRIGCHGGDDNHSERDRFGGHTVILADKLDYASVIDALEKKNFYASTGPRIYEMKVEGNRVSLTTSPAERIQVYYGAKNILNAIAPAGETVTEASFEIPAGAKYLRASVRDGKGRSANSRGFFPDEWQE